MENNHWTTESWGSEYPPVNYQAILDAANALIDACDPSEAAEYSESLWETYCATDSVGGVTSIWEE